MWASVVTNCGTKILRCRPLLLPRVLTTPIPLPISPSPFSMDRSNTSSSFSFAHSSRSGGRGTGSDLRNDRERTRGRGGGGGGGSGKDKIDALGRLLTRVLRHMASELNLNMRSDGYVKVEDLLKLNLKTFANIPLRLHTIDDIREAVRKDNKQRFSLLEENGQLLIRANQGHTVTVVETESLLKPILSAEEVPVCVHGTYKKNLESILESGLKRMKRLHVHFSCGLPTDGEVISGMRRDVNVLIFLDVKKALDDGMKLYISDNKVILTEVKKRRPADREHKRRWSELSRSPPPTERRLWRRKHEILHRTASFPLLPSPQLHHDLTSQDQPNKRSKKFDHLILGPAAGQGHPDRLQCSGTKALNITHLPETSRSANTGDNIQFVTVFTIYNASQDSKVIGRSTDVVKVGDASYSKVERSIAVLNVFIDFIQVSMPQSNVMILTDPASDLPVRRSRVTVYPIQGEYSRDTLMLQRIRSYISFLDAKLEEQRRGPRHINHYFFTDSDMAVVGDLGEIFHKHPKFHLALTFRNNKAQPLNSGFIAVRGTEDGILRAKAFLQEVLKIYSSKFMKASRMLGDQLALAWVIRSNPSFDARKFSKAETFIEEINGASVLFLPCALYNWTPPEGAGQFHGMPLNVKVVHFKGSRKRLMLESWNFFRSSSSISDMLCLILTSGRTKYDF
ncbi:unnamed protein product [Citrullus colocynthis]|uniref:2'-phosphotransferase n=1 Tax=Citrullus colocynthis TaxID=252529 RepID=A0ABP0YEQ2_9ROSI